MSYVLDLLLSHKYCWLSLLWQLYSELAWVFVRVASQLVVVSLTARGVGHFNMSRVIKYVHGNVTALPPAWAAVMTQRTQTT
jgi:hypothetical protein